MEDVFEYLFRGNAVYIFGAGVRGKECLELLKSENIQVVAFLDNDVSKHGKKIAGVDIESPRFICSAKIVITVWKYYAEIREQLEKLGYDSCNIISYDNLIVAKRDKEDKGEIVYEYPHIIQLPITYLCNFDCVMCGMHHMISRKDFSAEELRGILQDKLFSQVEGIGINGGEPFLKADIIECFTAIIDTLPKLKSFNIISNGYYTEKIINVLKVVKQMCEPKGISVNLSISIDGINDMQDFHRGKKYAFVNANNTCREILKEKSRYVDSFGVICTITRYNIEQINEVLVWAEEMGIEVEYNIATYNVRIENQEKVEDFSLLKDEHAKMLATEFFYCQYMKTGKEKYFALYLYLRKGRRYADCPCMHNEWITVTPDTQISFCATHSKNLGSGLEHSAYQLVAENLDYLQEIKDKYCERCSHYCYRLNAEGIQLLYADLNKRIL